MKNLNLTQCEEQMIEKYKLVNDQEIALYFFNKMSNDIINIVYSKINLKFASTPFERDDLISIAWKTIKESMIEYKKGSYSFKSIIIRKMYFKTIREIRKYLKNSELIMNIASSFDTYSQKHLICKTKKNGVVLPNAYLKSKIDDIIEFVVSYSKTYDIQKIKQIIYLKSLGYSEREIAIKLKTTRKFINNAIKHITRISKFYLNN